MMLNSSPLSLPLALLLAAGLCGARQAESFPQLRVQTRQAFVSLALKLAPNFDVPHAKQCLMHALAGNTKQSLTSISRAIQINPKNYDYYHVRGDLFSQLNSAASAINDYKKAIQLLEPLAQQNGPESLEALTANFLREKIQLVEDAR